LPALHKFSYHLSTAFSSLLSIFFGYILTISLLFNLVMCQYLVQLFPILFIDIFLGMDGFGILFGIDNEPSYEWIGIREA
jgi:hypothetical protein